MGNQWRSAKDPVFGGGFFRGMTSFGALKYKDTFLLQIMLSMDPSTKHGVLSESS